MSWRLLRLGWSLLVVAVGGAITACDSSPQPAPRAAIPPSPVPEPAESAKGETQPATAIKQNHVGTIATNRAPTRDFYDPSTIPTIELTMDAPALATLANAAEVALKTWVHATLKVDGTTFADVGVRIKGASTLRLLPDKASLKVKLNKWVKGQKLHGLEALTLNNMVSDPTFLAERLTYHVFRSLGLPAPKANTAHVSINGEDYGIYANIETPDENFLARAFAGKARSLYEVNWGSSWLPDEGGESGFEPDVALPGAPDGTKPDVDRLFQAVALAKNETLLADLEGHLHTRQWLRHSAAEAVTGHYDGYAFGMWSSHNYFMAGDVDGKFSLVPWSTDLSLSDREGVPDAANPRPIVVLARCKLTTACWDTYKSELRLVLDSYEKLDLQNLAKTWHAQIAGLVTSDPKRSQSLADHESETELLYQWIANRPNIVRGQLGL
jgi:CotH kinase protein